MFRIPASLRRLPLLAVLVLVAVAACQRETSDASGAAGGDRAELAQQSLMNDATAQSRAPAVAERRMAAPAPSQELRTPPPGSDLPAQMLIRTGNVSVRVDSLEPAVAAVRALATRLGGFVGNVSVSTGEYEVRSATLELRIPSGRFDEAMGGMVPLGKVEHSSTSVQDVGEEFVDVSARIANAKRLETRLVQLLATRTGKLEDVLAVERELARVREEIERREGRLRFLGARVELSTVQVTVSERVPVVGNTPGQSVIGRAFVEAWRNFVGLVAWAISAMGVLVPVAILVWGVIAVARRKRRAAA